MGFIENYYVDKEKKVVVCKLTHCSGELICDLCKKNWPGHDMLFIDDTFVGKATCSDEDVFDVDKGKKIAFKRAYAKLTKAKQRTLRNFHELDQKAAAAFSETCGKLISHYDAIMERKAEEVKYIAEN